MTGCASLSPHSTTSRPRTTAPAPREVLIEQMTHGTQLLFDEKVISRAEMDRAEQALRVSQARADSLRERRTLVDSESREEDRARAKADVALARARVQEARAMLDKTVVRSPISGIVLRRHAKAGESVSTQFDSPIVTLADRSSVRVRMDVDESDIARARVGQAAYVTADAFGTRRFPGTVVRVGQILGKKKGRIRQGKQRHDQVIHWLVKQSLQALQRIPRALCIIRNKQGDDYAYDRGMNARPMNDIP